MIGTRRGFPTTDRRALLIQKVPDDKPARAFTDSLLAAPLQVQSLFSNKCVSEYGLASRNLPLDNTLFRIAKLSTNFCATKQPSTGALLVLSIDSSACRVAAAENGFLLQ